MNETRVQSTPHSTVCPLVSRARCFSKLCASHLELFMAIGQEADLPWEHGREEG